ncbi:MAG: serine/threonine-protein kinase [Chloroflexi bacterium]|nr:serine/threonine-protein kinase [Chloroflexota bacterium]
MSSFDAYTSRVELGRGGMSTVYRAVAPDGSTVALKVLAIHLAADRNALIRFQNEIRLLEELDHPNIVRLFGADLRCNPPYLVMEYVEGMSLDRWVTQSGVLSPRELAPLLSDVARALDYAHDRGIVHRDVKPSNILIRRSTGRALLTDFGVAKSADVTAFTATHARVGSVYYMSPEQVEGRLELTRATDVYSLGVTAYLALTGRHPFEGTNEISIARKHIESMAQHISDLNPDVPRRVGDVVLRALEKHPHRRHETAGDFARRFRAAVSTAEAMAEERRERQRVVAAPRASRPVHQHKRVSRSARARRPDGWIFFMLAVFAVVCCALGIVGLVAISSRIGAWPIVRPTLIAPIPSSADIVASIGGAPQPLPLIAATPYAPTLPPEWMHGTAVVIVVDGRAITSTSPVPSEPTAMGVRRSGSDVPSAPLFLPPQLPPETRTVAPRPLPATAVAPAPQDDPTPSLPPNPWPLPLSAP